MDLGAPGSAITSCKLGGGYIGMQGTSMATPHVAGAAALLFQQVPNATWEEAKEAILAGVDPLPSLDGLVLTGGRLNAAAAG